MAIGFKPHVNRVWEFAEIMAELKSRMGPEVIDNPGWLGLPMKFYIPFLDFEDDTSDNYGQIHVVKIKTTGAFYINRLVDAAGQPIYSDPILYFGGGSTEGFVVAALPDESLELSHTTLYDKDGMVSTPAFNRLFRMWGTSDVETLFSTYFGMRSLQKLKIGSLKKAAF